MEAESIWFLSGFGRKPTLLYSIPPIGSGTSQVESFRNYLRRLALEHSVGFRRFCTDILSPLLDAANKEELVAFTLRSERLKPEAFGSTESTEKLVQALEKATGRSDLRQCTLRRFANTFSGDGLYARWPRHCPTCYAEDVGQGELPYERLLWLVQCVKCCPLHGTELLLSDCAHPEYIHGDSPTQRIHPSVCPGCGSIGFRCITRKPTPATIEDFWVARQVSELLAQGDTLRTLDQAAIRSAVLAHAKCHDRGVAGMAARAGVAKSTLWTYLANPASASSLDLVLRVCRVSGWDVSDYLMATLREPRTDLSMPPRRKQERIDATELRMVVEELLDAAAVHNMAQLEKATGVDKASIRKHLPDLVDRLEKESNERAIVQSEWSQEEVFLRVTEALIEVMKEGGRVTVAGLAEVSGRAWSRGSLEGNIVSLVCAELGLRCFAPTYRGERLRRVGPYVKLCVEHIRKVLATDQNVAPFKVRNDQAKSSLYQ